MHVVLLAMLWVSVDAWPVKISRAIELADGRVVGPDYMFLDGDDCTLTVDDPAAEVDWSFVLDTRGWTKEVEWENYYNPFSQLAKSSSRSELRLLGDVFKLYAYRYVNGYPFEDDPSRYYNKGVVYISRDGERLDSLELMFDLLPPVPEVISGRVTGDFSYDWFDYTDAVFTYTIKCPRATWLFQHVDWAYWWEPIPKPGEFGRITEHGYKLDGSSKYAVPTGDPSEQTWTVVDIGVSCDDLYVMNSCGKYGDCISAYSYSQPRNLDYDGDTIRLYDYITDPEILAALDRFRDQETGVSEVTEDPAGKLRLRNGAIVYTGDSSQVGTIAVTDLSGRTVKAVDGAPSVDVSSLKRGIYIAVLTTRQRKTINHKFIIQ